MEAPPDADGAEPPAPPPEVDPFVLQAAIITAATIPAPTPWR
jgi:hypothetical protein